MRRVALVTAVLLGLIGCGADESTGPSLDDNGKVGTTGVQDPGRAPSLGPNFVVATNGTTTIATDKDDYVPREPVAITGSGWQPGETVVLTLAEEPRVHADRVFEVVADSLGNIVYDQF